MVHISARLFENPLSGSGFTQRMKNGHVTFNPKVCTVAMTLDPHNWNIGFVCRLDMVHISVKLLENSSSISGVTDGHKNSNVTFNL